MSLVPQFTQQRLQLKARKRLPRRAASLDFPRRRVMRPSTTHTIVTHEAATYFNVSFGDGLSSESHRADAPLFTFVRRTMTANRSGRVISSSAKVTQASPAIPLAVAAALAGVMIVGVIVAFSAVLLLALGALLTLSLGAALAMRRIGHGSRSAPTLTSAPKPRDLPRLPEP